MNSQVILIEPWVRGEEIQVSDLKAVTLEVLNQHE